MTANGKKKKVGLFKFSLVTTQSAKRSLLLTRVSLGLREFKIQVLVQNRFLIYYLLPCFVKACQMFDCFRITFPFKNEIRKQAPSQTCLWSIHSLQSFSQTTSSF